jgi:ubiquinone/menaquinone biosynthesis C-methylase UbiE
MKISENQIEKTCPESQIYNELLSLDGKQILELGCGSAEITRDIATEGFGREITATEVDEIQYNKNLMIDDLPNVQFIMAGAENIPAEDEMFDIVMMFKSLHHVPPRLMPQALQEVTRLLKPGGLAYISEPIFKGDFNEVLRLFHDEETVREQAFLATKNTIDETALILVKEIFFNIPMAFENFAEFENKVIGVTHTQHQLSDELYQQVKEKFSLNMQADGAHFLLPIRVDLLQKAA